MVWNMKLTLAMLTSLPPGVAASVVHVLTTQAGISASGTPPSGGRALQQQAGQSHLRSQPQPQLQLQSAHGGGSRRRLAAVPQVCITSDSVSTEVDPATNQPLRNGSSTH